jgi:serine protease Do
MLGGIKNTVTAGIIMNSKSNYLRVKFSEHIVTVNLPLRPGNSSGPLIDMDGRLVGINTMISGMDTEFAIAVNAVKDFLANNSI